MLKYTTGYKTEYKQPRITMTAAVHAYIHTETYNLNLQVLPVNEFPLRELYTAHTLVGNLIILHVKLYKHTCVSRMFKATFELYCMSCG